MCSTHVDLQMKNDGRHLTRETLFLLTRNGINRMLWRQSGTRAFLKTACARTNNVFGWKNNNVVGWKRNNFGRRRRNNVVGRRNNVGRRMQNNVDWRESLMGLREFLHRKNVVNRLVLPK